MRCVGESHSHGRYRSDHATMLHKPQVLHQCLRIAGDVQNLDPLRISESSAAPRLMPARGGSTNDDVRLIGESIQHLQHIAGDKPAVVQSVQSVFSWSLPTAFLLMISTPTMPSSPSAPAPGVIVLVPQYKSKPSFPDIVDHRKSLRAKDASPPLASVWKKKTR